MKDERLATRSETKNERREVSNTIRDKEKGGCRERGRRQLRWEDCVKRDQRKAEDEEKWSENNREKWKK